MPSPWQSRIHFLGELGMVLPAAADSFAAALQTIRVRITTAAAHCMKPGLVVLI